MKIRECIDQIDSKKPNQYTDEDKLRWLNTLDAKIHEEIIMTHQGWDGKVFEPYTDYEQELIAKFPYDELYPSYLEMKIDESNKETQRYNNSATLFNAYYEEFEKHHNRTHRSVYKTHLNIWRR